MRSLMPWRRGLAPVLPEMAPLFRRIFGDVFEEAPPEAVPPWTPRVDLEETDKEIILRADIPGVEPKDVEVTVADGMLMLRGERKEEREKVGKGYRRTERFLGKFYREIPLPEGADPEKITAAGARGVLTVTIPRKPEAEPKKIPVKAEG